MLKNFWLFQLVLYSEHASEELRFQLLLKDFMCCVCAVVGVKRRKSDFSSLEEVVFVIRSSGFRPFY